MGRKPLTLKTIILTYFLTREIANVKTSIPRHPRDRIQYLLYLRSDLIPLPRFRRLVGGALTDTVLRQ